MGLSRYTGKPYLPRKCGNGFKPTTPGSHKCKYESQIKPGTHNNINHEWLVRWGKKGRALVNDSM